MSWGERAAATPKAFATPWVVCRNVAYPPPPEAKKHQHIARRRAMDAKGASVALSLFLISEATGKLNNRSKTTQERHKTR